MGLTLGVNTHGSFGTDALTFAACARFTKPNSPSRANKTNSTTILLMGIPDGSV